LASAQDADTLSISGTFHKNVLQGTVGADLAGVFARGNEQWWSLTLHGVTYWHDYFFYDWIDEWGNYGYEERYITLVHATSFDFQFGGADADVLNQDVSQQLVKGDLGGDTFLEFWNGYRLDPADDGGGGPYTHWSLTLLPVDPAAGVSFSVDDW